MSSGSHLQRGLYQFQNSISLLLTLEILLSLMIILLLIRKWVYLFAFPTLYSICGAEKNIYLVWSNKDLWESMLSKKVSKLFYWVIKVKVTVYRPLLIASCYHIHSSNNFIQMIFTVINILRSTILYVKLFILSIPITSTLLYLFQTQNHS